MPRVSEQVAENRSSEKTFPGKGEIKMSLLTRQNPDSDELEVFVNDAWVKFEQYREKQIDEAYDKSVRFLRERLGEDDAQEEAAIIQREK